MKDAAYYIKTGILMILLTIESYALTDALLAHIRSEDYFTPSMRTLGIIAGLLLLIIYTYSLTVGAWKKWEQFIIVPLPISLGIFGALFPLNSTYATLVAFVAYVLVSYDVLIATKIKDSMIKFNPVIILRFSTKGLLFLFALLAAIMVLLHSADKRNRIDLGSKIAELAQAQLENVMQPQPNQNQAPSFLIDELEGKGLPPNPELFSMLSGMQGTTSSLVGGLPSFNLDLKDTVKREVDRIVEPYQQFIPPLIALVVFALIRFLGGIVHLAFNITVPIVFGLAKSLGLFHIVHIPVTKEELTFSTQKEKESKA